MTKLNQIRSFLENEKKDAAIISDPVTIHYLTGFYSDPHERQMFLFVFTNQEPLLFVPALEVERASSTVSFPVVGYVDSENPWQKIKATLPVEAVKAVAVEFDNLILTKYHGLKTVFEQAEFTNLTPFIQRMRLIKSADEIQKMLVAGQYADKAVNIGFDNISLNKTETDIIAQIDFAIKQEGYEMSFETMVLTGNNAANPHGIPGANKIENNALLLFDLGCMVNGYASDMTRTVAVGQPDQFKKDIYHLTLEAQQAALDFIKPGKTEIEIANFLDFRMRELGAAGLSFDTILASGINSSKPHAHPMHKPVEAGEAITMDFGCLYDHYVSDMTRTIYLGHVSDEQAEIYNTILKANQALIDQAKAGLGFRDFDKIPRDIIIEAGYGDYFTHGIGHGIGLDIHEEPYFSQTSKEVIKSGMVLTDEPGIYIEGKYGVRIEDDILITETGCELLTLAPKELIVI